MLGDVEQEPTNKESGDTMSVRSSLIAKGASEIGLVDAEGLEPVSTDPLVRPQRLMNGIKTLDRKEFRKSKRRPFSSIKEESKLETIEEHPEEKSSTRKTEISVTTTQPRQHTKTRIKPGDNERRTREVKRIDNDVYSQRFSVSSRPKPKVQRARKWKLASHGVYVRAAE